MEPLQPVKAPPSILEVGLRLSIRSHDPEGGFRDLLGHLVGIDQIRKKNGEIITFDARMTQREGFAISWGIW